MSALAAASCLVGALLSLAAPAQAGGSTGKLALSIRPGSGATTAALAERLVTARTRRAPQVRASAPGPTASLVLRILPATNIPLSSIAADWRALMPMWSGAAKKYGVPWQVLAAINRVESDYGRNLGPSSAGALGWMQFMPATWASYGVDASGDGVADPNNPLDAITSAARYLAAAGARSDLPRAVFAYNHATWYVDEVLALARAYGYR